MKALAFASTALAKVFEFDRVLPTGAGGRSTVPEHGARAFRGERRRC
jgi:hypothetical protein